MRTLFQAAFAPLFLLGLLVAAQPAVSAQGELHGNATTKIYHNSGCRFFSCKKCTVRFQSADEARKQGYKPCSKCKG